jgi:hypothetical protein
VLYVLGLRGRIWWEIARSGKMVLILLGLQSEKFDFVEVRILKGLGVRGLRSPEIWLEGPILPPGVFGKECAMARKCWGYRDLEIEKSG